MIKQLNLSHSSKLMKRKTTGEAVKAGGYYVNEFVRGFWGEYEEGKRMLETMGLSSDHLPFSASIFLTNKKAYWKDKRGNLAKISFIVRPHQIECFGNYLNKRKSFRVFLEWSAYEDEEKTLRLESEAIGDLCMRCIYELIKT